MITSRGSLIGVLFACAFGVYSDPARTQAFGEVRSARVDYSRTDAAPRKACESLASFRIADLTELHAQLVAAADAAPAYCKVTGIIAPEVAFEVSLPTAWNGRFYMIGNGGHAGESLEDGGRVAQRNAALRIGFAFAQTNTGHDARKEPGASFVLSNAQKAVDYAYRAVHVTATTAKAITREYYGRAASHSYWNSCSNGGRQGLIEAQRYPKDFDGLIVNAPWVSQTGFTLGAMWNQKALDAAPLTPAKLALVAERVMARCDAVDGVRDELIDDPRRCDFDARRDVAACAAGADGDACLTAPQADAVMKIYEGPRSNGKPLFPGFMPGSEAVVKAAFGNAPPTSAWMNFIQPLQPGGMAADFGLAQNTMRYLVMKPPQPEYDVATFDFDRDPPLLDAWAKLVNADDPDLGAFRRRGGKLLMTYGWADQVLQPMMGVTYYERAVERNGPRTPEFFRLFMVPGMTHCAGGNGTDQFDSVSAIVDWVEKGAAPDSLHAAKIVDGKPVRTRPLCPYPQVAKYSGQGSIDDAAQLQLQGAVSVTPASIAPLGLLALVALVSPAVYAADVMRPTPTCDRACLYRALDGYLAALTAHDPSKVAWRRTRSTARTT